MCVHVAVKMDVCTNVLEALHRFCLNIFIYYAGAKHLLSPAAVISVFVHAHGSKTCLSMQVVHRYVYVPTASGNK